MKRILHPLVSLALLLICIFCAASQVRILNSKTSATTLKPADAATQAKVNESYGRLPLSFEINRGQADPSIKFLARGANYNFSIAPTEATLQFRDASTNQPATVRMNPVNANPSPKIEGLDQLPGKSNYLIGADPKQWRRDIPNYARVRYEKLWPGVDAVFYGNQQRFEYDFVVAPGADPRAIRLSFDGAKKISVGENGDLVLSLDGHEMRQLKPVIYQEVNGEKRTVAGRYIVKGGKVGFEIGRYDRSRELVIDPVLVYAARTLAGAAIAVDGQGAAYIAGRFASNSVIARDICITKLNPDGAQQVYSTIIGGSDYDEASGIAVDATGNVYVTGVTSSTDFPLNFPVPTTNAGAGVVFKSVDGGGAWNNSGRGLTTSGFGGLSALVIDPANPSVIYAEDTNSITASRNGAVLYKSVDGGKQWTHIKLNDLAAVKPLAIAPGNPSTLFVNTSQGLRKSSDGGTTFSETGLNRSGISTLIIDPNNPANLYATDGSVIFKSVNGGNSWGEAISGLPALTIKSLALDAANPSTLYVALFRSSAVPSGSVYKSVDSAATWTAVSDPPSEPSSGGLAVHPTNSTIYVGARQGAFKSIDGGKTWQSAGLNDVEVLSLVFDPINPSTIYALTRFSGAGDNRDIYKSTDAGMTWNSVSGILKKSIIGVLAIDPLNPATIYAGTEANSEAFVLKLDPTGQNVVYATYYGGPGNEDANDIAIDSAGNAYITGAVTPPRGANATTVGDGPTPPLVNNLPVASGAGFMAKLNAQGSNFVYSTLLEGIGRDIAVDSAGKAYVTGSISSAFQMTAKNGFKTSQEDGSKTDGFVVKLDPEKAGEESLLYATYLGDSAEDGGKALALDAAGLVYVVRFALESIDQFSGERLGRISLSKIDPSKSGAPSLVWERQLASTADGDNGVAVDADGEAYVIGSTNSGNFPVTPDAYQPKLRGGVCRRIPVCANPTQSPCVCSPDGHTPGCIILQISCSDVFLMKVNATGTATLYSTYLGNDGTGETAASIAVDAAKNVYITGGGGAPFTEGAFQNSDGIGFIAKLAFGARSTSVTTVSAANYVGPQLAQESLAVGFLDTFGAAKFQARVKDSAGTERNAPVFFSGSGQINFQIPPGTAIGDAMASIIYNGQVIASGAFQVAPVAPGVFTADSSGAGLASAIAQRGTPDGNVTYEAVLRFDPAQNKVVAIPIDFGPETDRMFLAIFGTGWRFRSSASATKVTIDGIDVPALYVGLQPSFNGLDQLNVELPRTLAGRGEVDLKVTVDGKTANTTRITFK